MKSILDNRPELKAIIDEVAEVTSYLWQKVGQKEMAETSPSTLPSMSMKK